MRSMAESCENLVTNRVQVAVLEVTDYDVVDGAEGSPHNHDAESDDRHRHCLLDIKILN